MSTSRTLSFPAVAATALGGAVVPLLALDPVPPWWAAPFAAAAAVYAAALLRLGRSWVLVLGVTGGLAVLAGRELEAVSVRWAAWALGLVLGSLLALFLALPARLARRARDLPGDDVRGRLLVSLSLWLGALGLATVAVSGTMVWIEHWMGPHEVGGLMMKDVMYPRLVGDGRSPWVAALSALALGAALAAAARRDARRIRSLRRIALTLLVAEAAALSALAASFVYHLGPLTGVVAVAPGAFHTCALLRSGDVVCWGWNWWGQLGDGTHSHRYAPVRVVGVTDAVSLHPPCARLRSGEVRCWGSLTGPTGARTVAGLPPARLLATDGESACAVTEGDDVFCWDDPSDPRWVARAPGAVALSVDHWGGCVEVPDRVQCWRPRGSKPAYAMLAPCARPPGRPPPLPDRLTSVTTDIYELAGDGQVYQWNRREKPGDACEGPRVLKGMPGVARIDGDLALGEDGSVRTWREDEKTGSCVLEKTWDNGGAIDVRSNRDTHCVVRVDGTAWCWGGRNDWGELGDGSRWPSDDPTQVRR